MKECKISFFEIHKCNSRQEVELVINIKLIHHGFDLTKEILVRDDIPNNQHIYTQEEK
jgi:hypothetical protein